MSCSQSCTLGLNLIYLLLKHLSILTFLLQTIADKTNKQNEWMNVSNKMNEWMYTWLCLTTEWWPSGKPISWPPRFNGFIWSSFHLEGWFTFSSQISLLCVGGTPSEVVTWSITWLTTVPLLPSYICHFYILQPKLKSTVKFTQSVCLYSNMEEMLVGKKDIGYPWKLKIIMNVLFLGTFPTCFSWFLG